MDAAATQPHDDARAADTLAERGVRGPSVRLLTAHRAKGLQWRLVVVAGVQEGGWVVIALFTAVVAVIASLSALTARETKDVPTDTLGIRIIPAK